MRQTGRFRTRFARLVQGTGRVLLVGAIWAVVLAEPAASPPAWPVAAPRQLSLHADLTRALADRTRFLSMAASRSDPAPEPPPVVWPAAGVLTGWFGEQRGRHRHPGVDIDGGTGDPVVSAAAGRVAHAGPSPAGYGGYGTVVIVAHGDGLTSIYAHLSQVTVRSGDEVVAGQRVGSIGTSGSVTGSHLHFELRRGGVPVNPRDWLPER